MYSFGEASRTRLQQCDQQLIILFDRVIKIVDCSILEGHRIESVQNQYFAEGKSKVKWPESKHNRNPSHAIDVAPYPIDWGNVGRFRYFGGIVIATAFSLGIDIRWGGDWDGDNDFDDQTFNDLVHFELRR